MKRIHGPRDGTDEGVGVQDYRGLESHLGRGQWCSIAAKWAHGSKSFQLLNDFLKEGQAKKRWLVTSSNLPRC